MFKTFALSSFGKLHDFKEILPSQLLLTIYNHTEIKPQQGNMGLVF